MYLYLLIFITKGRFDRQIAIYYLLGFEENFIFPFAVAFCPECMLLVVAIIFLRGEQEEKRPQGVLFCPELSSQCDISRNTDRAGDLYSHKYGYIIFYIVLAIYLFLLGAVERCSFILAYFTTQF